MNEEKIEEVFSDEEFVKSLMELETPEEVQKALEEKDIDLNVDEIKKLAELLQKKINGELSDDDLQSVAGGCAEPVELIAVVLVCKYAVFPLVSKAIKRGW